MVLFALSFVANVVITFTVAWAIYRNHPGMNEVYGQDTPARRILACIYAAIGLVSLFALAALFVGNADRGYGIGLTLFPLQIVYKLLTAVVVRVTHPVVIANLCVVALLGLALSFA